MFEQRMQSEINQFKDQITSLNHEIESYRQNMKLKDERIIDLQYQLKKLQNLEIQLKQGKPSIQEFRDEDDEFNNNINLQ